MRYRKILISLLGRLPASYRHRLKRLYEQKPGFGKRLFYAQYGEDAFLQSYFQQREVMNSTAEMMLPAYLQTSVGLGFYVDVGAHDPVRYSNTFWFYQRGWRGINIDAAPGSAELFQRKRPRDISLEALVSDEEQELTFYYWDTPFLVNTLSLEHARYMALLYGREPRTIVRQSSRLDTILEQHLSPDRTISFMSIDVEGHDLHVLRSNDWERFRPEIVLVEDLKMRAEDPEASEIYLFMYSVGYEMYAWLRPTVVYRQVGLRDWLVPDYD